MPFSTEERDELLRLKGVGPTVLRRLEQIGVSSLAELCQCTSAEIADSVATMLDSTCWKNSPQAKSALDSAIALARERHGK